MEKTIELELRSLLPGLDSDKDGCIRRLEEALKNRREMSRAHIEMKDDHRSTLCLHFDPEKNTVEEIRRLAEQAGVEILNRYKHESMPLLGMDCSDCALAIEHTLGRSPGVLSARASYPARRLWVEYDSQKTSLSAVEHLLRVMGYQVPLPRRKKWLRDNRALLMSLAAGVLLLAGWAAEMAGLLSAFSLAPYLAAYAVGGWEIAVHAFHALRQRRFDTDLLMLMAALGAAALGEFAEGALLIFLFSLGHALEDRALDKARRAIESLSELAPRMALVRGEKGEVETPVEKIRIGDRVVIRPGARIPVDGQIFEGISAVDQAPVTGESIPVDKSAGDQVYAGTINGQGTLEVRVTRLADDSTLARVVRLVEDAQAQKSPAQRAAERLERIFVPGVLSAAVLAVLVPPLFGLPFHDSFLRAMTLLVAASPCALALGAPAAVLAGLARSARKGVLIKGGAHLENLGLVKVVAFDKTGTITTGRPEVVGTESFLPGEYTVDQILTLAAALETQSGHPLAAAVVRAAGERNLDIPTARDLVSLTGRGLRADIGGQEALLGSLELMRESGLIVTSEAAARVSNLEAGGKTVILAAVGGRLAGLVALADTLRPEAAEALRRLGELGIRHTALLSGDNEPVARAVAAQAGVKEVYANLMPGEKADAVGRLAGRFGQVAMVGDGVNDAPALASASVGIAMGGAATDVALETADVALMGSDLSKLPFAVGLGRAARRVIHQNLVIALGVIAVLAVSSLAGWNGMGVAVAFHEGSTILVVLNALRLLNYDL